MKDQIVINTPMGEVTLTKEQVEKMFSSIQLLENAALSLVNPEIIDSHWDFDLNSKEYKEELLKYFLDKKGWSNDFIKTVFHSKN